MTQELADSFSEQAKSILCAMIEKKIDFIVSEHMGSNGPVIHDNYSDILTITEQHYLKQDLDKLADECFIEQTKYDDSYQIYKLRREGEFFAKENNWL